MRKIYIRWLGAFRNQGSFHESLTYEFSRDSEVAAEIIEGSSRIDQARVGLLLDKKAIVKEFNGDCWSVYEEGLLVKTRNPLKANSFHKEAFAVPNYVGIVCKGYRGRIGEGYHNLPRKIRGAIKWFALQNALPVYNLVGSDLIRVANL